MYRLDEGTCVVRQKETVKVHIVNRGIMPMMAV
jgi:hypothetical protein